jgi:hypothetical protein
VERKARLPLQPAPPTHPLSPGSSPVEVFFSNPDLLWANEHPRPRFGQGAFAAALEALHRQTTGGPIACARYFGKPNPEPYRWAAAGPAGRGGRGCARRRRRDGRALWGSLAAAKG